MTSTSGEVSLEPADYSAPTPDRRPATREFAGERLARAICADREMVNEAGVSAIANALAAAQIERIGAAIATVRARHHGAAHRRGHGTRCVYR